MIPNRSRKTAAVCYLKIIIIELKNRIKEQSMVMKSYKFCNY
jgi:hypothetical protein